MTRKEQVLKRVAMVARRFPALDRQRSRAQADLITALRRGREIGLSLRVLGEAAGLHWTRVQQLTREESPK